ncbi:MAG: aldolase/citrate lyase family protein [Candidatus Bathyarchaeia archaeon]
MKKNKVKQALAEGETVVGTMITETRTPEVARLLAASGFDFIFVDMEHSAYSLENLTEIVRTGKAVGLTCLARIADPQYHLVARTLDCGAQGLLIPRVETRETVEDVVRFAKYPPWGERGFGIRSVVGDYEKVSIRDRIEEQNEDTMVIPQIERVKAIENIEDLVSVKGVDVALIGPQDLSISLGIPGEHKHQKIIDAIGKVVEACKKYGVASGIHTPNMEDLLYWRDRGMTMLTYSTEAALTQSAALQAVAEIRKATRK